MSVERPRRNAKKLPDPDFFVDLPPSFSPPRGQKRRSSFDEGLEFLDELMIAIPEGGPKKTHKRSVISPRTRPTQKSPPTCTPRAQKSPNTSTPRAQKSPNTSTPRPQKSPTSAKSQKSPPISTVKAQKSPQKSPTTLKQKSPLKSPTKSPKSPQKSQIFNIKILPIQKIKFSPEKPDPKIKVPKKKRGVKEVERPVKLEPPTFRSVVPLKSEVSPTKRRILKSTATTPKCRVPCCTSTNTHCFVNTDTCCGSGQSSRWYHISSSEHYCNACFEYFYRSTKDGHPQYTKWRKKWSSNSQYDPTSPLFMSDQILPYWLQCHKCHKWRQIPRDTHVTYDVIKQFTCGQFVKEKVDCGQAQDKRVEDVQELNWITSFTVMPYLDRSPASPYLQNYYPDGCGLSAHIVQHDHTPNNGETTSKDSRDGFDSESSISTASFSSEDSLPDVRPVKTSSVKPGAANTHSSTQIEFFQPFHQPEEAFRAYCVPPDSMLDFEIESFSEFAHNQQIYLALRNLVITLWCLNYKEWLTVDKCVPYVICRGLGRIRVIQELSRVIDFLTRRGYINQGIICPPESLQLTHIKQKDGVIVVGAGPSGLAAARQLSRFGVPVRVLEARNRIGGRVWDNNEMSARVGHGAMIVVGHINNPITLLCHQLGLRTRRMLDHCDLFTINGEVTEVSLDHRIEVHFNAILDAIAEWRRHRSQNDDDDLLTRIIATHEQILRQNNMPDFTEEEKLLLEFHISNLEYACGCELSQVSALQWDQNEIYPQFMGQHSMIKDGYSALLHKLADRLDIQLNTEVTSIEYGEDGVKVTTRSGDVIEGSRVIVTLPLALLQQNHVTFNPPLPETKLMAIDQLGAGIIEKVVLEFPERFWDDKLQGADFFGLVPPSENERGLFGVFYDITAREERDDVSGHVLMTWVSGSAVKLIQDKTDQQVIDMCMSALRQLFSGKSVCEPIRWFVTRWGEDPFSRMSYSYVPVGSSGQMYTAMSEDVDNTVYFAGEATNRQFPQTVTGAYLSGVREADKILTSLRPSFSRHQLIRVNESVPGKRGRKASFMKAIRIPDDRLLDTMDTRLPGDRILDTMDTINETNVTDKPGKVRTSTAWVRAPKQAQTNAATCKDASNNAANCKDTNNGESKVTEKCSTGKKRPGPKVVPGNGVVGPKRGRPPKNPPKTAVPDNIGVPDKTGVPVKPVVPVKGRKIAPKPEAPVKIPETDVTPAVMLKQRNGEEVRRSKRIRFSVCEEETGSHTYIGHSQTSLTNKVRRGRKKTTKIQSDTSHEDMTENSDTSQKNMTDLVSYSHTNMAVVSDTNMTNFVSDTNMTNFVSDTSYQHVTNIDTREGSVSPEIISISSGDSSSVKSESFSDVTNSSVKSDAISDVTNSSVKSEAFSDVTESSVKSEDIEILDIVRIEDYVTPDVTGPHNDVIGAQNDVIIQTNNKDVQKPVNSPTKSPLVSPIGVKSPKKSPKKSPIFVKTPQKSPNVSPIVKSPQKSLCLSSLSDKSPKKSPSQSPIGDKSPRTMLYLSPVRRSLCVSPRPTTPKKSPCGPVLGDKSPKKSPSVISDKSPRKSPCIIGDKSPKKSLTLSPVGAQSPKKSVYVSPTAKSLGVSPLSDKSPRKSLSFSPKKSPCSSPTAKLLCVSSISDKSPRKSLSLTPKKSLCVSPAGEKSPRKSPYVSPLDKSPYVSPVAKSLCLSPVGDKSPRKSLTLTPKKSLCVSPAGDKPPRKSPYVSPVAKSLSLSPVGDKSPRKSPYVSPLKPTTPKKSPAGEKTPERRGAEGGAGAGQGSPSPGKSIKIRLRLGKVTEQSHTGTTNSHSGDVTPGNVTRIYEVLAVETDDVTNDVTMDTAPMTSPSNGMLSPTSPQRPRLSPQVAELSDHDYI